MPIWAYIYCAFIVIGTAFNLFEKNKIKNVYQVSGELLSGLCAVSVFLIAYDLAKFNQSELISTLFFIFTISWAYHAHRHYLNYEKFKDYIHKSTIEAHEETLQELSEIMNAEEAEGVDLSELEEIQNDYDFEGTEKIAKYFYIGIVILISILTIPYLYVYLISLGMFRN